MLMRICYNTRPFRHDDFELMCRVFQTLKLRNLELHLGHMFKTSSDHILESSKLDPSWVLQTIKRYGLEITLMDGGWCNLTYIPGYREDIEKQISMTQKLKVPTLRLFFAPYPTVEMIKELPEITYQIIDIATKHSDINFLFETHDALGTNAELVRNIMDTVNQNHNNVGIVFDPINFIMDGKNPDEALRILSKYVRHVHLKGCANGKLCAFGEGVDISSIVVKLLECTDSFGLEYEGEEDARLGLQKSKTNLLKLCMNKNITVED